MLSQAFYQCQLCNKLSKSNLIADCCFKIYCISCYHSQGHQCRLPSVINSKLDLQFCNRCLVKISNKQCQVCMDKNYCNDCFSIVHKYGKFQFHKYVNLGIPNQLIENKEIDKKRQIRKLQNVKSCINCFNDKRQYQYIDNNIAMRLKEFQNKINLQSCYLRSQQQDANQHWESITNQFKTKFEELISTLNKVKNQFLQTIKFKKIKTLQIVQNRIKQNNIMLSQIKNLNLLILQKTENYHYFILQKVKTLNIQLAKKSKININQEAFQSSSIDFIINWVHQLDFAKVIMKEKKKQKTKIIKTSSIHLLDAGTKVNEIKQLKTKRSNKEIQLKDTKSLLNEEQLRFEMTNSKISFTNKKKQLIRYTVGPVQTKKSEEYLLAKKLSYSKYR